MLPRHVHAVTWKSGTVAYYWQPHRGTKRQEARTRLPDDPASPAFWNAVKALQQGPKLVSGMVKMIDEYLASPKFGELAENSKREYRRYMKALKLALADFEPDDLQPKDVAQFRDALGDTPAKANAYMKAIAALYKWGRELGHAKTNPARDISKLKIGEYQPWPKWAWDAAMGHFREEIRTACLLGRYTGQRLGDVLRLKLTDITTDADGTDGFNLVQQKTGTALFVPISRELRQVLAEARKRGRICIVSRRDGTAFTVDQFHAMWGREMRKPEIQKIRDAGLSFHGLRKTNVTFGAENNLTAHQIGSITGQTIQTVQHYSKGASQKRLAKEAMRKLEGRGNE